MGEMYVEVDYRMISKLIKLGRLLGNLEGHKFWTDDTRGSDGFASWPALGSRRTREFVEGYTLMT
jgi:hypothetical protein